MVHGTMVPAAKTARERRGRVRNIKEYDATFDTTRGPEHRKTCSWVENVENHVSAIDVGHTSAQGSKTSKIMFLGYLCPGVQRKIIVPLGSIFGYTSGQGCKWSKIVSLVPCPRSLVRGPIMFLRSILAILPPRTYIHTYLHT